MKHEAVEKNIGLMAFLMVIAVSIGGLTQIVPLFSRTSPITRSKA